MRMNRDERIVMPYAFARGPQGPAGRGIEEIPEQIQAMLDATQECREQTQSAQLEETNRAMNESDRVLAEHKREADCQSAVSNANEAAGLCLSVEEAVQNAENARAAAESERVAAEEYRVGHESTRQMHENDRVEHEKTRISSETTRRTAETAREEAETARNDAETARAAAEEARDAAEADRAAAEEARDAAEQARQETFAGYEDRIVAATPDDTTVDGRAWTSKKTVDSLCMPFEASGNPVQVYPVEGYPLGVKVSLEPVQAGSGDPSPDNIRPITGRDSVSITIGNGMDSKTTDIALPETVYGGELDLSTGVVTVDWEKIRVLPGTINKSDEDRYCYTAISRLNAKPAKGGGNNAKSNVMVSLDVVGNGVSGNSFAVYVNGIIRFYIDGISTLDEMVAYATENPIEIAYALAEPYTIQLTPQQIAAIDGTNTLYTDSGTLTVTGREDPRHTIVTLTDRISALESAAAGV